MFGTCIRDDFPDAKIIYFVHERDLSPIFKKIDLELGFSDTELTFYDENTCDYFESHKINEVIFSNRYDNRQVRFFEAIRSKKTKISFLEEGASIYLKYPYFKYSSTVNLAKFMLKIGSYALPRFYFDKSYTLALFEMPRVKPGLELFDLREKLLKHVRRYEKYDNSTVLLSQWLVKQDYISSDKLIEYYARVFEGHKDVFYKPHPWDDEKFTSEVVERCGFKLIETELPVELLLLKSRNVHVFGFWTTTLFYLDKLTDNQVYSLMRDVSRLSPALSSLYNKTSLLIKKSNVVEYESLHKI